MNYIAGRKLENAGATDHFLDFTVRMPVNSSELLTDLHISFISCIHSPRTGWNISCEFLIDQSLSPVSDLRENTGAG